MVIMAAQDHVSGYSQLAFDFAFCKSKLVNLNLGVCADRNVNTNWDLVNGEDVISPANGTVAYYLSQINGQSCADIAIYLSSHRVIVSY